MDEIRKGEISLSDAKNNQNTFKLYLGEIKKGGKISKEQKMQHIISNYFTKQGKKLLNFLMIIL